MKVVMTMAVVVAIALSLQNTSQGSVIYEYEMDVMNAGTVVSGTFDFMDSNSNGVIDNKDELSMFELQATKDLMSISFDLEDIVFITGWVVDTGWNVGTLLQFADIGTGGGAFVGGRRFLAAGGDIKIVDGFSLSGLGTTVSVVTNKPVPEPATVVILGLGLVGIVGARYRKKRASTMAKQKGE